MSVGKQKKKMATKTNWQSVRVAFKSFISLNSCYSSDVETDFTARKLRARETEGLSKIT